MWSATNSTKCCATCVNWAGERKAVGTMKVETPTCNSRGKCYAGVIGDATSGPCACSGHSCAKYIKWGALK